MSFPTYDFTPKVDNVDTINAADVNELQTAIEEIAARSYSPGFPMAEGVWYDNRTAIACSIGGPGDQDEAIMPGKLYASPFRVFEAVTLSSVGVTAFNGLALVDSVSVSIYSPSATAGPGEKIAGPIAIAIPSEGDGFFSAVATVPLDSGTYFFVVSGNAEGGVAVGAINDATSGVLGIVADSLATGYFAEVAGVPGIMPSDLTADVTAANLVNISVQVLFQITHD